MLRFIASLKGEIGQDWEVNKDRPHIQIFLALFRAARYMSGAPKPIRLAAFMPAVLFKAMRIVLGIDLPMRIRCGPRLQIHHGFGLVVHPDTQIGSDVVLRHGVTLGNRGSGRTGAPTISNRVDIGAGAAVIGPITVGPDCRIGVNAVVVSDVDAGAVVLAPPAVTKSARATRTD